MRHSRLALCELTARTLKHGLGLLGIQLLAGDQISFHQLLIAGKIATGICQRGFIFGQLALRLSQSNFELAGIYLCQQVAGFYLLSFLEV